MDYNKIIYYMKTVKVCGDWLNKFQMIYEHITK